MEHGEAPASAAGETNPATLPPTRCTSAGRWLWLLPPVLVAVIYSSGIRNDFVNWDDDIYIRDNPYLQNVEGLANILKPGDPVRKFYPATYTSHWLEYRLWGTAATGYYAVNVALHALNAVLVLVLLQRLGASRGVALLAAVLFAVHPVQAPSVAWLASRKTLLSTAFALGGFLAYWHHRQSKQIAWSRVAMVLFALALLSKTAAITLIASALLADWLILRRRLSDVLIPYAPFLIVVGGVLIYIDSLIESSAGFNYAEPVALRPLAASAAHWFYAWKLIWPIDLALIYPKWTVTASLPWLLPAVGLAASIVAVWSLRRRLGPLCVWGAGHWLGNLLPILGLLSFGYLKHSPVGDQYVYPAAVGFFLIVALAVERLAEWVTRTRVGKTAIVSTIGVAAAGSLGWVTWNRVPQWGGQEAFWSSVVSQNPAFSFGRRRLADAYQADQRWEDARGEYERLIEEGSEDPQVFNNLGLVLNKLNRPVEALEQYRLAARSAIDDVLPEAQLGLASTQKQLGMLSAEIGRLRALLEKRPDDRDARFALAASFVAAGQSTEFVQQIQTLVNDSPGDPRLLYGVAFLLRVTGNTGEAAKLFAHAATLAEQQRLPDLWFKANRELASLGATGG